MKWIAIPDAAVKGSDGISKIKISGKQVCLIRNEGQLYATSARCPHAGADLSGGWCEDGRLICPHHRHAFNLQSGRGDTGQGDYITVYPLKKQETGWFIGIKEHWLKKWFGK